MAKLKTDPITKEDMEEFVRSSSDFEFEMQTLRQLRALDFECSHGATYQDPVTGKVRQYDIRAVRDRAQSRLALAVECKNFGRHNPLLVSAVPRTLEESFHNLINCEPKGNSMFQILEKRSAYRTGELVGKKTDQVGCDSSNSLVGNDGATFDKLNQAVNSCQDLVKVNALDAGAPRQRVIVPLVVVPKDLLWQVDYDADGTVSETPRQVSHATLFIDHTWNVTGLYAEDLAYRLSHVEFVTLDALPRISAEDWPLFFRSRVTSPA